MRTIQVSMIGAALIAVWASTVLGGARDATAAASGHAPIAVPAVLASVPAANVRTPRHLSPRTLEPQPAPAASPPAASEIPEALEAEREAQQFQAYFRRLDAVRESEERDVELEQQVERALDAAAERLQGSQIERIACSRTLCRVNARHDDLYARRLFLAGLHHTVGPLLPEASIFVPPAGLATEAYFARAGHSLPHE